VSTPLPPPGSGSTTSTQEIPVVPAAVANTQHLPPPPAAEPADGTRTTGPVDFVPQPPRPEGRAPTGSRRRAPVHLVAPVAALLGVVVLELGLLLRFGTRSTWSQVPLWSAFASLAAVLVLSAVAGELPRGRRPGGPARRVAWVAVGGLAVFWLLVALPTGDTDRGFLLTAAVAMLAAAAWLGRGRGEG
jgi:hypothetical protein